MSASAVASPPFSTLLACLMSGRVWQGTDAGKSSPKICHLAALEVTEWLQEQEQVKLGKLKKNPKEQTEL